MKRLAARLAHLIFVLFGVSFLVFMLINLLPGDPAEIIAGASNNPSPTAVAEIREQLGLNEPVLERYGSWLGDAVQGELGRSYRTNLPVLTAIKSRLPVTLELVVLAEVFSLAIAVPLAVMAAYRRDRPLDRAATVVTFGLQSIPNFVVALVLIFLFAVKLEWLPALGYVRISEDFTDNLRSLAIPAMALSTTLIPVYFRVLRNEMIRTLQEDFILMARAEGLSPRAILFKYALKPSLPTLVTVLGINVGALIGGTLIVELISGLPGLGTMLFDAISARDYIVVQGVVLVVATAYVLANFVVDVSHSFLDPRVRARG